MLTQDKKKEEIGRKTPTKSGIERAGDFISFFFFFFFSFSHLLSLFLSWLLFLLRSIWDRTKRENTGERPKTYTFHIKNKVLHTKITTSTLSLSLSSDLHYYLRVEYILEINFQPRIPTYIYIYICIPSTLPAASFHNQKLPKKYLNLLFNSLRISPILQSLINIITTYFLKRIPETRENT